MSRSIPLVSVAITTRDRPDDVIRALESAFLQDYQSIECVLVDDASSKPIGGVVRERFPSVRMLRNHTLKGVITARSQAYQACRGEYIIGLDDDAEFADPGTARAVVEAMEADPRIGAIGIAFTEPNCGTEPNDRSRPTLRDGQELRSFTGCAHAVRRNAFEEAGGYRNFFFRQGEERDLCIRLRERGYRIVFADVEPVVHRVSPIRNRQAIDYYGIRNTILFEWLNVPHPYVLPRIAYDSYKLLRYKLSWQTLPQRCVWLAQSWGSCFRYRSERAPVARSTYSAFCAASPCGPVITGPTTRTPAATAVTTAAPSAAVGPSIARRGTETPHD